MSDLLNYNFLNNTILNYLIFLGIFVLSIIITKIIKYLILRRLKKWAEKTESTIDDIIIKNIENAGIPVLYFLGFYLSLRYLNIDTEVQKYINYFYIMFITSLVIRFLSVAIRFIIHSYYRQKDPSDLTNTLRGVSNFINIIVWTLGIIFLLDNLGVNVSAVITGLGIGGIAVALAAQAILGDLFSYFVIFFDKPFKVGDFINVDNKLGTIEHIGIKTTRIRSLSGEELIVSNNDLTKARIHNFKKLEKRRVVFLLGVTYETPLDKLKQIPEVIRKIINENADVNFDRVHFKEYGAFSLNYEIVYYVIGSDYNLFMDRQQNINLRIFEEFEKLGIQFAYPTQTLYINNLKENSAN